MLFIGCVDRPSDNNAALPAEPSDATPLPGPLRYVGFWPAPTRGYQWDGAHETYTPMHVAWRAAGANGVLLNCADPQAAPLQLVRSVGYEQRLLAGPGLRNVSEWEHLLSDSAVNAACSVLYLDDGWFAWTYDGGVSTPWTPFDPAACWRGFDSLLTLAERFDKDIGLNLYSTKGIGILRDTLRAYDERHRDRATGRVTTHRLERLWIFSGALYFDGGSPRYLTFSDAMKAYVVCAGIDLRRMIPWIAPSCSVPRGTGHFDSPGCSAEWTFNQILHVAALGYGGAYFYLANGFDAEHRDMVLLALWACGNLQLPLHPRPRTYGELRSLRADSTALQAVLLELRSTGVMTHLPGWEWEQ